MYVAGRGLRSGARLPGAPPATVTALLKSQRGTPPDTDNSTSRWKSNPQKLLSPPVQSSVATAGREDPRESCQEQEQPWTSFQKQCRVVPAVLSLHLPLLLSLTPISFPEPLPSLGTEATGRVTNSPLSSPGLAGNRDPRQTREAGQPS